MSLCGWLLVLKSSISKKMNKQQERRNRGKEFEEEIRRSWSRIPNIWRLRIADGGGASRPGDELVLTPYGNLLIELKRTEEPVFRLDFLRTGQIKGLLEFEHVLPCNYGLIFVSFLDVTRDEVYGFRLFTALKYMRETQRKSIPIQTFRSSSMPSCKLPLYPASYERHYDLEALIKWLPHL